jgi:PAS domain S-box-containing protein
MRRKPCWNGCRRKPAARVDLAACTHLHPANLQVLMAASAMDSVGIGILWTDLETGCLTYVNPHMATMLGYRTDEMTHMQLTQLYPSLGREGFLRRRQAIRERGRDRLESTMRAKDGHLIPVDVIVHLQSGDAATPEHAISFVIDITQRKEADLALAQARWAAESARLAREERIRVEAEAKMRSRKLEAVGTLAAGIAHDFNNILGCIVGFAEMTVDVLPEGSVARRNVAQILSASFRARDLSRACSPSPARARPSGGGGRGGPGARGARLAARLAEPSVELSFESVRDGAGGP